MCDLAKTLFVHCNELAKTLRASSQFNLSYFPSVFSTASSRGKQARNQDLPPEPNFKFAICCLVIFHFGFNFEINTCHPFPLGLGGLFSSHGKGMAAFILIKF